MNCRKCNREIQEDAIFCPYCGAKQQMDKRQTRRGNGQGTAVKRGKGWMAIASVGTYLGADGEAHRVRRSKGGFATKRDALAYIPQLLAEAGTLNPDKDITFSALFERWFDEHAKTTGDSTMGCYRAAFGHMKAIWHRPMRSIGVEDYQALLDACPSGKRTRQNMRAVITLLTKYAYDRDVISKNVAPSLSIGKSETKHRPAFTPAQIELIRQQIGVTPMAEYVYCLIYLGFRPGEMLALKRESFHQDGDICYFVGGSKTEAGTDRIVVISDKILPYVKALLLRAQPYLFAMKNGQRMSDAYFRERVFFPVLDAAGIQPIPKVGEEAVYVPYCCRHTCATLMKNIDGSLRDKGAMLGHTDATMTMHYQDADLESLARIANAL